MAIEKLRYLVLPHTIDCQINWDLFVGHDPLAEQYFKQNIPEAGDDFAPFKQYLTDRINSAATEEQKKGLTNLISYMEKNDHFKNRATDIWRTAKDNPMLETYIDQMGYAAQQCEQRLESGLFNLEMTLMGANVDDSETLEISLSRFIQTQFKPKVLDHLLQDPWLNKKLSVDVRMAYENTLREHFGLLKNNSSFLYCILMFL